MEEGLIDDLTVQSLQGEFYGEFKKYRERHGGQWTPRYQSNGLLDDVHIQFPRGTTCGELTSQGVYDRRQITFQDGAMMFWFFQHSTNLNSISIPFVYL